MRGLTAACLGAVLAMAAGTACMAQGAYKVGDHVEAYSPMAGRWVAGTIVALDGARFMFQADDHSLANDFWGTMADRLRPLTPPGAAQPGDPQPAGPPRVDGPPADPPPAGPPPGPPEAPPAATPQAACGGGGGGSIHFAGARPAPLGQGTWPSGERLGTPGQTNYKTDAQGRKTIVAVAPPGQGPFVGRYNLMVGGTWSTISTRDLGGGVTERTLNWNVPARANVLAINGDGTWCRKSGEQNYCGRWIDLGQNVVQLVGYDGDDWTGSMQMSAGVCRMEMRSWLGQNEWGRRF